MNRRNFAAALAAAAASRAYGAGDARRNGAYLLEFLRLQQGTQRARLDEFYTGALLPAMNRLKMTNPLIMEGVITPHTPEMLLVLPFADLAELSDLFTKLDKDPATSKALAKLESGPEPPYESRQMTVVGAAPYSPA